MRISIVFFGLFTMMVLGCKSENKTETIRETIVGEWDILDALRNGRRTTTLKDGYMHFEPQGELTTNILGRETTSNYTIGEKTISSDGDFEYSFNIEKLSGDTLLLSGRMKAFDMVFYLMKRQADTLDTGFEDEADFLDDINNQPSDQ